MEMLNPHCGIDRDSRGVVRLSICNAGSLNILSSAVTDGVRQGFEKLAGDNSATGGGQWFEGVMATGAATIGTLASLQANIVAAGYGK